MPVYTDLGALGRVGNTRADELVAFGYGQWSGVPTSSFEAAVAGDFASIGLPDIVCPTVAACNANLVIGTFNGGGIHVIYDTDGKILQNFFGVSTSVLGISSPEWAVDDSPELLESWAVINGLPIASSDPNGDRYVGVLTHEFGHSINLAHTQGNGAIISFANARGPRGCLTPYAGAPTASQVETMYPFISTGTTGTAVGMSTVDMVDDRAALSDIYPAAGWPESHGTIRGIVRASRRAKVSNANELTEITGSNVIARNIANPWGDFSSHFTGQYSKGNDGPDGEFFFNGLTPGAQYVIYVDAAANGAFSVPIPVILPGPEEYYNGTMESADGETDDRCVSTTMMAAAASPITADMTFNRVKGAPEFIPILGGIPTDISEVGEIVVGSGGSNFMWTEAGGAVSLGQAGSGGQAAISDDGTTVSGSIRDATGGSFAGIWQAGTWSFVPTLPGALPCGSGTNASYMSAWDLSGDGSTVVGLSQNGCATANARAFKWSAAGGLEILPRLSTNRANRANTVSFDGSVIAGWDDFAGRAGVRWNGGVVSTISPNQNTYFVGEAGGMTPDGAHIVGLGAGTRWAGWMWEGIGGVHEIGVATVQRSAAVVAISDDGSVMGGYTDIAIGNRVPNIWTSELGWAEYVAFLNAQGTFAGDWLPAVNMGMTADAKTIIGWAFTPFGQQGYLVRSPKAVICHAPPTNVTNMHTIDVDWPAGLNGHLAHGDTVGVCAHGGL